MGTRTARAVMPGLHGWHAADASQKLGPVHRHRANAIGPLPMAPGSDGQGPKGKNSSPIAKGSPYILAHFSSFFRGAKGIKAPVRT